MLIIIKKGKLNNGKFRAWISAVKDPEDHHWLGHYEEDTYIKIFKKPPFTFSDKYTIMQTDDFDNKESMNEQIDAIVDNAIENLYELKKTKGWDCIYDTQIIKVRI